MNIVFWFWPLVLLLLTGCSTLTEEKESNQTFGVEAEKVIHQSEQRVERNAALGPVIPDRLKFSELQNRRTFINKEEQQNYLKIREEDVFPVSLHLQGVEIHKGFQMFSRIIGRNILVGDEVGGEITASIHDVPWDKALDAILNMKDLAKHVDHDANIIRIHQRSVLTAQEEYAHKRTESLKRALELEQSLEPQLTEIFQLHYAEPEKIKAEIESVLRATAGGKNTTITTDDRTRMLIVQSTKSNIDLVEKLIIQMDQRTEQVLIEAYIIEVKDSFKEEFGARLGTAYNMRGTTISGLNTATTDATTMTGIGGADSNDIFSQLVSGAGIGILHRSSVLDLKLELSAMEEDGITNIISNPRVFTLNNSVATIEQGDQIPYKSSTADGVPTTEFKDAKVSLDVTPHVVRDGNLLLDIEVHKDSVEAQNAGDEPPITQRIIKTKLLVPDRSTVVIGGIYTQSNTEATAKVPLLGDLPGIGKLFRKETDNEERKELLIFISPYII